MTWRLTAQAQCCSQRYTRLLWNHYSDAIMSAIASQITGISIVCSIPCSCAYQRKHQSSASLREGNPPVTGGFPSQRASNAENVSIRWRHHVSLIIGDFMSPFLLTGLITVVIQNGHRNIEKSHDISNVKPIPSRHYLNCILLTPYGVIELYQRWFG